MRFKFAGSILIFSLLYLLFSPNNWVLADEPPKIYTLEESITIALKNNWSIKEKEESINEATFGKKAAKSDFFPKLSTTYGYTRLHEERMSSINPSIPLNSRNNYLWRAIISQPLFTGFALTSTNELAKLGIDISELELVLETLDVALQAKEAYYGVLIADTALDVAQDAVKSLQSQVDVANSFYKVGMIPINDLLRSEVELANARFDEFTTQNRTQLARSAFNTVLALPINDPVEVEDILTFKKEEVDYDQYREKALENRPEMKIINTTILQADQQIRLAKSKYYPEIALSYQYAKAGDSPDVSGSPYHDGNNWQITAGLSWTLWNWNKTKYSVSGKKSQKKQLIQVKSTIIDNISLEIKNAILDLEQQEQNIPVTKKGVEQAEESLRVSQERYKAQVTTATEVLDAQALLTQARVNYFGSLYNHNLARARLIRAIGAY